LTEDLKNWVPDTLSAARRRTGRLLWGGRRALEYQRGRLQKEALRTADQLTQNGPSYKIRKLPIRVVGHLRAKVPDR
jgi:hypothetical protein